MSLIIVPTPVGNLEDMTIRGIKVLRNADLIACEDTRKTAVLLRRYSIRTPMISYHAFNERARAPFILRKVGEGATVALVSDAGTPGISDPGQVIIHEAIEQGVSVEVLPGATAFVPALVASGFFAKTFIFGGFPPDKEGARKKYLEKILENPVVAVFYISPHKALRHISDILEAAGDVECALSREISKYHEEVLRGKLSDIIKKIEKEGIRGELSLVVSEHRQKTDENWREKARACHEKNMTVKDITREITSSFDVRKNEVKKYLTSLDS